MRALIPRPRADAPPKGGWLSLDVQHGCAGDMLLGALLGLGLDPELIDEALTNAHLPYIGVRILAERRGPLGGYHVAFVDEAGRPLEGGPERVQNPRGTQRPRGGRRQPVLQRDVRDVQATVSVTRFADTPDIEAVSEGPEHVPATTLQRRDAVRRWLDDEPVDAATLSTHLHENDLGPQASMLAQRCLRRILAARVHVAHQTKPKNPDAVSIDELRALLIPGRAALDLLCDVVSVAVLIEALSPVGIDASSVPFSRAPVRLDGAWVAGPCPWASAALGAHPAFLMTDTDYPPTTPTGAAWISVLAQGRSPERMVNTHRGTGLGTLHVKARANVCVARYGPIFLPGTAEAASGVRGGFRFTAHFASASSALSCTGLETTHTVRDFAIDGARVCGTVTAEDADPFFQSLVETGALNIERASVTRWDAALVPQAVTVRLGNRSATVDLVERVADTGEALGVDVVSESVSAAAQRLRITPARCALMALDVYDAICKADDRDEAASAQAQRARDPDGTR